MSYCAAHRRNVFAAYIDYFVPLCHSQLQIMVIMKCWKIASYFSMFVLDSFYVSCVEKVLVIAGAFS